MQVLVQENVDTCIVCLHCDSVRAFEARAALMSSSSCLTCLSAAFLPLVWACDIRDNHNHQPCIL